MEQEIERNMEENGGKEKVWISSSVKEEPLTIFDDDEEENIRCTIIVKLSNVIDPRSNEDPATNVSVASLTHFDMLDIQRLRHDTLLMRLVKVLDTNKSLLSFCRFFSVPVGSNYFDCGRLFLIGHNKTNA
ncbi:hypothetical protein Fot_54726 [Forsythia ovata]|uniref:Uncharacterized protein n=1 Tax=Forsythia ovata TaxID=205694 RepID=A0ABD1P6G8_9LAMI